MSEYEYGAAPAPKQMATETWCNNNKESVDEYIRQRVHGMQPLKALRRVFGEEYYDSNSSTRVHSLESTEYYKENFAAQLKAVQIDELWNEKLSVHKMLVIVNDDLEKGSTRLRAIQELNILIGITIVDENGKTRKGSSMADFYATMKTKQAETEQDTNKTAE